MIKVLHKAIDIIELLAGKGGEPLPLGQIAAALSLHQATCANILKTLVARGLVEQVERRGSYTLGPLAYSMAGLGPYRRDLVSAAGPVVARLAAELGESTLLASLHRGRRYILFVVEANRTLQVKTDTPYFMDVYTTATGRLLLAHSAEEDIEACIAAQGLPGMLWPAARDRKRLGSALEAIRREGIVINNDQSDLVQVALPITQAGRVVAALGVAMPSVRFSAENKQTVMQAVLAAADDIDQALTQRQI